MDKIHVLIVEDEPTLARIIKDALEANHFRVSLAADGEAGLEAFARLSPDILVADIMMPQLSGLDMVRRIRQTDSRTPILFLTAKSTVDDVVEGFHAGGNDYLKKPFGMKELMVRIQALLGRITPTSAPQVRPRQTDTDLPAHRRKPRTAQPGERDIGTPLSPPARRRPRQGHPAGPLGRRRLLLHPQLPDTHLPTEAPPLQRPRREAD